MNDRFAALRGAYEQATFGGDPSGLDVAERELDILEAEVALVRGQLLHARLSNGFPEVAPSRNPEAELHLFEQAEELYRRCEHRRGEAEARLWIGLYHQVVQRDHSAARPHLEAAHVQAEAAGDPLLMSYTLRHLGIADHIDGQLTAARRRLVESTELRRDLGFWPGVAANLIGLAYLAAADDDLTAAQGHLDAAERLARAFARGLLPDIAASRVATQTETTVGVRPAANGC
jgi:hypothetical protein